jgi:hypothetical protein
MQAAKGTSSRREESDTGLQDVLARTQAARLLGVIGSCVHALKC